MLEYIHESFAFSTSTYLFRIDEEGVLRRNAVIKRGSALFGGSLADKNLYRIDEEGSVRDNRMVDTSLECIEVSTGNFHTVTLTPDGKVYGYGDNTYFRLGPYKVSYTLNGFVLLNLPVSAIKVVAFDRSTAILDAEGNVWCRGKMVLPVQDWSVLPFSERVINISTTSSGSLCILFYSGETLEII